MTVIRPAPGVLSGFDEYGCAVVDTLEDRWFYLEGDRAWVWESVKVTGSAAHLEPEDIPHLDFLIRSGLMSIRADDHFLLGHEDGDDHPERLGMTLLPPATPWILRKSWNQSLRLSRLPLVRTAQLLRAVHQRPASGRLNRRSADRLQGKILETPTRWSHQKIHRSRRTLSVATALAAEMLGVRVDVTFGMRHSDRSPVWWCTTPDGPVGRPDRSLAVGTL